MTEFNLELSAGNLQIKSVCVFEWLDLLFNFKKYADFAVSFKARFRITGFNCHLDLSQSWKKLHKMNEIFYDQITLFFVREYENPTNLGHKILKLCF